MASTNDNEIRMLIFILNTVLLTEKEHIKVFMASIKSCNSFQNILHKHVATFAAARIISCSAGIKFKLFCRCIKFNGYDKSIRELQTMTKENWINANIYPYHSFDDCAISSQKSD